MTKWDKEYIKLCKKILKDGVEVENRTGTNTIKIPSYHLKFDLSKEFPVLTTKQLYDNLRVASVDTISFKDLNDALAILEREFKIVLTRDGYYELLETKNKKVGCLLMHEKGYGFVFLEDGNDIFIPANKLHNCIHNDIVLVRTKECNGKLLMVKNM